jgi:hypothetical protein
MLEDLDKKAGISIHLMDHEIKELTEYYKYRVKEEKGKQKVFVFVTGIVDKSDNGDNHQHIYSIAE